MNIRKYMVEQKCPVCGDEKSVTVLPYDRYYLNINLSVCQNCATLFTKNNFSEDNVGIFYKEFYRYLYNDVKEVTVEFIDKSDDIKFAKFRFERISLFCKENALDFNKIVEIGSGTGQFLTLLEDNQKDFFGIEPGNTFYNYLSKQKFNKKITNTFFEEAELPFSANFFVSFHVLEHIINPNHFLKNIYSKLSNGGHVIMEVPCYDNDVQWEEYGVMDIHIAHVVYYTEDTLSRLFTQNGFRVIKIEKNLENDFIKNNLRIFAVKDHNINYINKLNTIDELKRYQKSFKKFSFISKNGYLTALRSNFKAIFKLLF
ncbi:class I SAM-dependent methyltransferase [Aliarcobacter butzleri]|uniref:class I SAM-dependent methyltransferase n=1 Tax=Aliarcobacter butzleri TaxID=28197 RepID=UPI001269C716|nr:class I SAM-dependent methyltransferase [Aliarcobacter butzleri]